MVALVSKSVARSTSLAYQTSQRVKNALNKTVRNVALPVFAAYGVNALYLSKKRKYKPCA